MTRRAADEGFSSSTASRACSVSVHLFEPCLRPVFVALLANLGQRPIHHLVREVHSVLPELLNDWTSSGNQSLGFRKDDNAQCSEVRNSQRRRGAACRLIV